MNFSYITHKKTMSITSFTYRSNLNLVYKETLSQLAAFFGVPVSKSAGKPAMIEKIDSYVRSNPVEVLEKLCVKELELVREFVKAGPDTPVIKAPRRTYDTLKMLFLVSVCYDKKTRKEHLLMPDELRDLFAPHLDSVLKKARKKAKELAAEADMPVIPPSRTEIDDFDGIPSEEMLRRILEHILGDDLPTDGCFDDADSDGPDDDLELPSKTKYSMASELVTAVRNLHYNSQVKVFRAFHKFIIKSDVWDAMFLERFEESYGNICFDGGEVDTDTFEWVHYTLNDFDNALSDLDYNDPMSFFDVARRLEAVIAREEETETSHPA